MDKLQLAHEYALEMAKQGIPLKSCLELGWKYADAMKAEADKRKPIGLPEALKEEWQPDWSQAPETAIAWKMQSESHAAWIHDKSLSAFECSIAPTFNYQGGWKDSRRERPQ